MAAILGAARRAVQRISSGRAVSAAGSGGTGRWNA